jgi:hypothetical protein
MIRLLLETTGLPNNDLTNCPGAQTKRQGGPGQ